MPGNFITLAEMLRPSAVAREQIESAGPSVSIESSCAPVVPEHPEERRFDDIVTLAISDARRFRAVLADAISHAAVSLVREIASDVLARELQFAPCAMDALVVRLVNDHMNAVPLRVRISPHDQFFTSDFPFVVDAALQPGDAILECTSGAIDARLGVRLADVIERASERR